ncbi:DUF397 domain-containing protein [Streptomyces sp. NPDC026206]|uniref:DUF397 domain-containing protein n=1 Tax=Streptomyces sp. NPDC026206 TaxID=3157089 RepID=UPI003405693D
MNGRPPWFKSSYSQPDANCVEVAIPPGMVLVRDSKLGSAQGHPRITISPATWAAFTAELRGSGVEPPM